MKTKLIILFLIITGFTASGQMRYSEQWATNLTVGPTFEKGFQLSAGVEKYFNNHGGSLAIGVDYIKNKKFLTVDDFNIQLATFHVTYFYSLETVIRPPFFINIGAGGIVGIEDMKKKKLPEGVVQHPGTDFIWGVSLKPQFEYLFARKTSVFCQLQLNYYGESRFYEFMFIPQVGIKLYL